MSRNNLIGVVRYKRMYYVMSDLNADTEWNYAACVQYIHTQRAVCKKRRASALLIAHNIQKQIDTEYGVREIPLTQ